LINTALGSHDVRVKAQLYTLHGKVIWEKEEGSKVTPNSVNRLFAIPEPEGVEGVYFLKLILSEKGKQVTDNIYWLTTRAKDYTTLSGLPRSTPVVKASVKQERGVYAGTIRLQAESISFFNRIKVLDKQTGKRILPIHYTDNYITLMPGDEREVTIEFTSSLPKEQISIVVDSWTAERLVCPIN
jgi:hypothetical protein